MRDTVNRAFRTVRKDGTIKYDGFVYGFVGWDKPDPGELVMIFKRCDWAVELDVYHTDYCGKPILTGVSPMRAVCIR